MQIFIKNSFIMKKNLFLMLMASMLLTGCLKHDMPDGSRVTKEQINENVKNIFGTEFEPNHDWSTTTSGTLTINSIPSNVDKIQLMTYVTETDSTTSLLMLNEASVKGQSSITLAYDAPEKSIGMYLFLLSSGKLYPQQLSFHRPEINGMRFAGTMKAAMAVQRDVAAEEMADYEAQKMVAQDYSDEYKTIFRAIIFSYFKNGRQYNNLPLIKESGYFNAAVYPITTGKEPIVVSPVYKSDKAKQYGNEIWNSDLYYYYYKESDLEGKSDYAIRQFLTNLPMYKAIQFNQHFGETEDDVISKRNAYALIYWGDGTPEIGTTGSYTFPEGYKIGFMVRAKTEFKENGKARKQGELYGDGRLNNDINSYSECNFKSSKLGTDGPRMGWITVNERMLLCCESGTDSDFNDIILEVEGGVKPIINIPEFEVNSYTFCFEDTELGDYDMNDVVIKAKRLNETTVQYSIVACGARDDLLVKNINGNTINGNVEVHAMFGVAAGTFVNTQSQNANPVVDEITVDKKFSFLDESKQPYIYDVTTGLTVKLSKKGEDPHGIMIPYDFRYPKEKICIKDAYDEFNSWGEGKVISNYWYKNPIEGKVF